MIFRKNIKSMSNNISTYHDDIFDKYREQLSIIIDNNSRIAVIELLASLIIERVVQKTLSDQAEGKLIPLIVMRSGLFMLSAYRNSLPETPIGTILPYREIFGEKPKIIYRDIPQICEDSILLISDNIINTGLTMATCIENIYTGFPSLRENPQRIKIVSIFGTQKGIKLFHDEYPDIEINIVWDNLDTDIEGYITGINFDLGESCFGGSSSPRLTWINNP